MRFYWKKQIVLFCIYFMSFCFYSDNLIQSNWTTSHIFMYDLIKKVNHPQVGVNFNLYHWLKVEKDKDYQIPICENISKNFTVTTNGSSDKGSIKSLDQGFFDKWLGK